MHVQPSYHILNLVYARVLGSGSKDPFGGSGVLLKVERICNFGGGLWGPTKGMTTIWGHIVIYVLFGTVIFDK